MRNVNILPPIWLFIFAIFVVCWGPVLFLPGLCGIMKKKFHLDGKSGPGVGEARI